MSKSAQRKRLTEAMTKVIAVFLTQDGYVTVTDMTAFDKIITKCINRIK